MCLSIRSYTAAHPSEPSHQPNHDLPPASAHLIRLHLCHRPCPVPNILPHNLWRLLHWHCQRMRRRNCLARLRHVLFKQDALPVREDQSDVLEESMQYKKLTNAQHSGLSQISNHRFTLWWIPPSTERSFVGVISILMISNITLVRISLTTCLTP